MLFAALSINTYAAENDLASYKIDIRNNTTSGRTLKFDLLSDSGSSDSSSGMRTVKSGMRTAKLLELTLESGENYSSPDIKVQLPALFSYKVYKSEDKLKKEELTGSGGAVQLPKVYGHNPYKRTFTKFTRDSNLSLTIDSSYDEASKKGHLTITIGDVNSGTSDEL